MNVWCETSSQDPAWPRCSSTTTGRRRCGTPVAIHQAYAATRWIAEHGREIGLDGTRLAVVGNSAGGNMAAVVSLMAKDRGTPSVSFQLLLWPVTNASFDTASYDAFAEGHGMIHDFGLLNALRQVPGTRSALLHASEELRRRLGGARTCV